MRKGACTRGKFVQRFATTKQKQKMERKETKKIATTIQLDGIDSSICV
jgi:hypothetical protein